MILPRIPYTYISLPGLLTMTERTLAILNERHPGEPFFVRTIEKLESGKTLATKAMGSTNKALTTKNVTQADNDRDNSAESLKNHIRAGLKRNNKAYREACERLYAIFEKNNLNLTRLPYAEQTGALNSLLSDLSTPQAVTDLATVNTTEWVQELRTDQESFEEAIKARGEERAVDDTPTDTVALGALITALKSIFKVLDVAEENEQVEKVSETITLLNELIAEIITAQR